MPTIAGRFPPLKPFYLICLIPAVFTIPAAWDEFQQHQILNIVPMKILESRPDWDDSNERNSPFRNGILGRIQESLSLEELRSFSFVPVVQAHRFCSNLLCPLAGSFSWMFLNLQLKYRFRMLTPLERLALTTFSAFSIMCFLYYMGINWAYWNTNPHHRMELKYEMVYRIGLWLEKERDPAWKEKVEFSEVEGLLKPAHRSLFQK